MRLRVVRGSVAGCWWGERAAGCLSGHYSSCCPFDLEYHRLLVRRVCSTPRCTVILRQEWPNATVPKMCANWRQPVGFITARQYMKRLCHHLYGNTCAGGNFTKYTHTAQQEENLVKDTCSRKVIQNICDLIRMQHDLTESSADYVPTMLFCTKWT